MTPTRSVSKATLWRRLHAKSFRHIRRLLRSLVQRYGESEEPSAVFLCMTDYRQGPMRIGSFFPFPNSLTVLLCDILLLLPILCHNALIYSILLPKASSRRLLTLPSPRYTGRARLAANHPTSASILARPISTSAYPLGPLKIHPAIFGELFFFIIGIAVRC